jgi:hypothetical protein
LTKTKLYRRVDAAAYIRNVYNVPCAPSTLAKDHTLGGGPEVTYVGRWPMYSEAALDAWVAAKTTRARNTSERRRPLIAAE